MSGTFTRLLVIVGLLIGAAAHGSISAVATEGGMGASMAGMNADDCAMNKSGRMKPADCASICAVASADLARMVSLPHPLVRPSWRLADLRADGLEPSPDPTPPRA